MAETGRAALPAAKLERNRSPPQAGQQGSQAAGNSNATRGYRGGGRGGNRGNSRGGGFNRGGGSNGNRPSRVNPRPSNAGPPAKVKNS